MGDEDIFRSNLGIEMENRKRRLIYGMFLIKFFCSESACFMTININTICCESGRASIRPFSILLSENLDSGLEMDEDQGIFLFTIQFSQFWSYYKKGMGQ